MGVKRSLSLGEVKALFPSFEFETLRPSSSGVMDTTYISDNYILKFYERDIEQKIAFDATVLEHLQSVRLYVPRLLAESHNWYLYEKLQGELPLTTQYFHIQALARFMAKFHKQNISSNISFIEQYDLKKFLLRLKKSNYSYYKKLQTLQNYTPKNDGFIHGDIFKDNTLFVREKIGVFDFIDGGEGSYVFDVAVVLLSFNGAKRSSYVKLFLNTYNQKAPKKISEDALATEMKVAAQLYALLRICNEKNTRRAKELIFW